MSLAEKISSPETQVRALNPLSTPQIDNILRLALAQGGGSKTAVGERRPGDVDFARAAALLDRATAAIAHLTARRDELEQAATAREDYYSEKLRQLQDHATEWERRAKVIKAQLQDCETRLSEQQARIDTLTYRAENAEARVLMAEQTASEARGQLQLYHDKIVDTFSSLG